MLPGEEGEEAEGAMYVLYSFNTDRNISPSGEGTGIAYVAIFLLMPTVLF